MRKKKVQNKYKSLLIITNTDKFKLPFGDYLRILAFAPNLKFKKIFFVSGKDLLLLSKEHDFIDSIKITNKKLISSLKKSSFIFDIENDGKNSSKIFYLKTILNPKKNKKQNMTDLIKNIAKYFKIKKYKLYHNKNVDLKTTKDVYFSWQAPNAWKIKEYSSNKLHLLNNKIKYELGLSTKFQKKKEKLSTYIKNIKSSKIVVSIVNLGCHISNLFDKNLIMLSGPNYHEDSSLHKSQITIFPKEFCNYHKKIFKNKKFKNRVGSLSRGTNKCYCMDNIEVNAIYNKIKKIINEKI